VLDLALGVLLYQHSRLSTPHWEHYTFRRLTHPFPSHFPSHRAWEESFPATPRRRRAGRILPSSHAPPPGRILPPAHTRWRRRRPPWTPALQRTEEAERQAERGKERTGQWWLGDRGWPGSAPRLLQPDSLAQSASTIQQYKGTATARSSSSSPASAWYQRPTVSCVKRFLPVSVELLTLLELWSVVAEQVRRGLSHHSAVRCTREIPRAPTFSASRPSATRASTALCVFRVSQNGKRCWPMDWRAATRQLWPVPASVAILSSAAVG